MNAHLNPEALEELKRIKSERQEREKRSSGLLGEWDAGDDTELPPPRGWLLGNIFCRGFMSSLLADGGVGKPPIETTVLSGHPFESALLLARKCNVPPGLPMVFPAGLAGKMFCKKCPILLN